MSVLLQFTPSFQHTHHSSHLTLPSTHHLPSLSQTPSTHHPTLTLPSTHHPPLHMSPSPTPHTHQHIQPSKCPWWNNHHLLGSHLSHGCSLWVRWRWVPSSGLGLGRGCLGHRLHHSRWELLHGGGRTGWELLHGGWSSWWGDLRLHWYWSLGWWHGSWVVGRRGLLLRYLGVHLGWGGRCTGLGVGREGGTAS